jgi:hypothetical protein
MRSIVLLSLAVVVAMGSLLVRIPSSLFGAISQTPSSTEAAPPAVPAAITTLRASPAESMERKLQYVAVNGERAQPNLQPTQFTEMEVNAWLASGRAKLPKGVHRVQMVGLSGQVTATAEINFDEVKEGRTSMNPLLSVFGGTHEVHVLADAVGSRGRGSVHVRNVEIDGVSVPRIALEFFIDRYLKPKYPNIGLDTTFNLPSRIDTAAIGAHTLTVMQK